MEELIRERLLKWINQSIIIKELKTDEQVFVDVPILDSYNDFIRVYVEKIGEDKFRLSDNCFLSFESNDVIFNYPKKMSINFYDDLNRVLNSYACSENKETREIFKFSNLENLSANILFFALAISKLEIIHIVATKVLRNML